MERNLKRSLEKSEHSVRTQLKNSKEIFENSQGAQLQNRFWSVTPVCSKSKRNMERFFEYAAARTQLERNSKNATEEQLVRNSENAAGAQQKRNSVFLAERYSTNALMSTTNVLGKWDNN